jgi:hypothetical protein
MNLDGAVIDSSVIGGTTPAAGTFTTLTANTSITGTLATAAQPNITSVGTLTALTGGTGDLNWDSGTLFVDSSANSVGIGTASPASNLHISGAANNTYLRIDDGTEFLNLGVDGTGIFYNSNTTHRFLTNSGGTECLRILSDGKIGIGTSSPLSILDVKNATNEHIVISGSATYGNNAIIAVNDIGGEVGLGLGGNTIEFYTGTTERMRIDSSGNVRIGATTGFHKVCIAHDDSFTDIASGYTNLELSNPNGTNGTYSRIVFNDAAGGPGSGILGVKFTDTTNNYGQFEFWTRSSSGGSTKMVIDPNGNVGIGTTSPSAKLELNGGDAYFYNTASTGGIRIGYDASNYWDVKRENASIGNLRFYSNGTERVSFLPGGGITFNGDTAAANALDDYEEGTWTPSLTNATGTFTSGGATYTKVGRIVTVNFRLNPSGTAGVVANSTYINNLPISINATSITPVGAFTDVSSSTAGIMGMHGAVSTRIYFTTSYSTGGYISGTLTYESA